MKKYCFFIMLIFAGSFSYSQTLQEINEMMGKSQYKKAKEGIDKFLSDPKNAAKSDGFFYKGRIYNSLSKDSAMVSTEALKLKIDAFEAFKKYQQMDAKELPFILENHGSYFDLYNGFFDVGAKEFNSKNFAVSFEGFKNAIAVEDYVRTKGYDYGGFKFPVFDTALVLNTAIAAGNAKDTPSSIIYYKKLADQNLSSPDYLNIYQYLVEYYNGKNDQANFNAMMEKGRKLYPQEKYWTEIEVDIVAKTGNKEALNAKYEELMKRYPEEFSWPYNLGVEIYNELYSGESKIANSDALKARLTEIIKAAIAVDKGIDAKTLMTRHLYNAAYDYQDSSKKIKGVKPEDVKKRADAKAMFLKKIDECIPYAEGVTDYYAAMATLKPIQKANYKIILDLLSQMYATKGDLKKSAEYDKKKAALN
jgi:hypothetical protein